MNRSHLVALPLLALSLSLPLLLLPGCGRGKGSATPQAAQELAELRMEQELSFKERDALSDSREAEIAHLLARFDKTADATLASTPHRITLLHLACVYKKAELARCLLLDGADPNARQLTELPWEGGDVGAEPDAPALVPGDTPLTWATIPQREGATAEEMLPLINLLVEKGAEVNQPGMLGLPPLVTACFIPSPAGEAVVLRLLELGARGSQFVPEAEGSTAIPLSALIAANGWHQALEKLLDTGAALATPARSALHGAAERSERAGALDCARLLLARGAEVDTLNDEGATPLYVATHALAEPGGNEPATVAAIGNMAALLLQHGADPLRCCDADPDFPGSCAADFIAMSPAAQEALAARGITVPRRPIHFEAEGTALLTEICRASLFGTPAQEIAPHRAKLVTLLTLPPHELAHSPLYPDAFGHAVKLLSRAEAASGTEEGTATAGQIVANLPLWKEQQAWASGDARSTALMEAILSTPELMLPREQLLEHARRMDAWGVSEVAALLVELLERDPDAAADIEALSTDASPAMRAGALTARLLRAGLPAPRNGAVAAWMAERGVGEEEAPASLRRALLLTSLDKFWYGDMAADEVRALLEAMRGIGAPNAAAFYAELAASLNKPEELDRLTAPGGAADAARYELECATALFIWSQREEWLRLGTTPAPTEGANAPQH